MVTKEKGAIAFSYNNDDIFNDVGLISAYMTKNLANEGGSLMDEFIITDDERELFDVCVKQAVPNIFDEMLKMSTCTKGFENKDGKIKILVADNKAYNENVLPMVDATIYDCLKFGIIAEFYSICVNATLQSIARNKFAETMMLLNKRLFQLKKRGISSLY
jgi:hypothetical protein